MAWGKLTKSCYAKKPTALLCLLLGLALLVTAACIQKRTPSPTIKTPSKVITEEGIEFSIFGLKLPGNSQELKLKEGGATTWLPLSIVLVITFTGPELDQFRPADIILTSGEKLRGDLFVGTLIEGTSDVGYWNMPLAKIKQIGMGEE